ncbi:hypothetical protein PROFUN_13106 [Planoprotostelium fungivorum]|uniref:SAP domain-containing protein n=1 Tax=Planoprotostelium fungivorum TaxID=1890364 RepID=A0A2P6N5C1_9EUKA|nr:hypothetical protein PROFUN_13106 [Planoprotostelium fungivorum]
MESIFYEKLNQLFGSSKLEDLNQVLEKNNQLFDHTEVSAAVNEIIGCIRKDSHRALLDSFVSHYPYLAIGVKVRAQRRSINDYLRVKGLQSLIDAISEENLRILTSALGSRPTHSALMSAVLNGSLDVFLQNASIDFLRSLCEHSGISKSGNDRDLIETLQDFIFPYEQDEQINTDNAHPSDVMMNGVAIVTRDSNGDPTYVQFVGENKNLRRLCVFYCGYSSDPILSTYTQWNTIQDESLGESVMDIAAGDDACVDGVDGVNAADAYDEGPILEPRFSFRDMKLVLPTLRTYLEPEFKEDDSTEEKRWVDSMQQQLRTQHQAMCPPNDKGINGIETLIQWLDSLHQPNKDDIYKFEDVASIVRPNTIVKTTKTSLRDTIVCYLILGSHYVCNQSSDMMGRLTRAWNLQIDFAIIVSDGSNFLWANSTDYVSQYKNFKSLHSLGLSIVRPGELNDSLVERGRRYTSLSLGQNFVAHKMNGFEGAVTNKPGRIVLDIVKGVEHSIHSGLCGVIAIAVVSDGINRQQNLDQAAYYGATTLTNRMTEVPEEYLAVCWPAISGFNFTHKRWGYALVDLIHDIQFNNDAFDQLVMEPTRKTLIYAVVKNSQEVFSDIIAGKGGGSIFLLHGPPGTGKTLTAEAVAEVLHKPLYYVSVGELGTDPANLEIKLQKILDLAAHWKAVLLMDEADVFLEQRGYREVERNAMVGVMLRLLEYYQGILFLTSNRVQTFDAAFYSRITVALRYDALDVHARTSIWLMLMKAMKVEGIDPRPLADFKLNGRQIKNCISLSQSLAAVQGRTITLQDLQQTVHICQSFIKDMEQSREIEEAVVPQKKK